MKTKDRILEQSLVLLNEHGYKNLTIRDVAKAMEISHGNVGYHYPNMNSIVNDLYLQLAARIDSEIAGLSNQKISLELLYKSNQILFNKMNDYRFLFLDFVDIMRSIPSIKSHYKSLAKRREQELMMLLKSLQHLELFRKEFNEEDFRNLVQTLFIFGDFWISSAEILFKEKPKEKTQHYLKLFFSLIKPYLSSKGLKDYKILFA